MSSTLRISLKSGDRIFVNGAVLRADRKVTLEILNDVKFLLEHHFLNEEAAHTPLRRLYFLVQSMLTDPAQAPETRVACLVQLHELRRIHPAPPMADRLAAIAEILAANRPFEALKAIRALFPSEASDVSKAS
ncbi:MAG: flagellar biosynthesis repressor FlbT [Hyphomicrobiaceae bacterium]|nr:flagellar biosynthesis repressor FlbT [Hyphomicrobiaceae bacterium]